MSLLSDFRDSQIESFKEELEIVLRCGRELDRQSNRSDPSYNDNEKMFLKFIDAFNAKYPAINVVLFKKAGQYIHLLIKNKDLQSIFEDCVKIPNITGVGTNNFDKVSVGDSERMQRLLNNLEDTLYVSFAGYESSSIVLKKLNGDVRISLDENLTMSFVSPEFQLFCYYALSSKTSDEDILEHVKYFKYKSVGIATGHSEPAFFN